MLREKQKFKELRDSYTIFITQKDKLKCGLPIYHIDRVIRETNELFEDGSHIIYVNGSYKGNDAIGKLMHDFACKRSADMYYDELKKSVRQIKEEGDQGDMCEAIEEYVNAYVINTKIECIQNVMDNLQFTLEQAIEALNVAPEDQTVIRKLFKEQGIT